MFFLLETNAPMGLPSKFLAGVWIMWPVQSCKLLFQRTSVPDGSLFCLGMIEICGREEVLSNQLCWPGQRAPWGSNALQKWDPLNKGEIGGHGLCMSAATFYATLHSWRKCPPLNHCVENPKKEKGLCQQSMTSLRSFHGGFFMVSFEKERKTILQLLNILSFLWIQIVQQAWYMTHISAVDWGDQGCRQPSIMSISDSAWANLFLVSLLLFKVRHISCPTLLGFAAAVEDVGYVCWRLDSWGMVVPTASFIPLCV